MRYFLTILALFIFSFSVFTQDLLESRTSSYYTYLYKITDSEAKKIFKNDLWRVDSTFFHTLIKAYPTDSIFKNKLPAGHYLKVYTEKNNLKLSITSVPIFDVKILNNNTDLNILVYDLEGQIINDAKVILRNKRLKYDKKTKAYRDKKSNHHGLLKVSYQGFTSFYSLDREYNNSQFKRTSKKMLYSIPVKYVWIPVRFIVFIPIDGVKSIIHWSTIGSIYHIKNFFRNSYRKIACIFDDYHCDNGYQFTNNHKGYLVFNKPKYMPGDTVKFKAFVVDKKGKPIYDEVEVLLGKYGKDVKIAELRPYRNGAYEYQFPLHDSLQLLLDSRLELTLRKNENKVFISDYFTYEDYELSKVNLEIRTDDDDQYKGKEFTLFAKGTDENELNLLDGNLELLVLTKKVNWFYDSSAFIPDTLFYTQKKLDPKEETSFIIPDSIFPKADFSYDLIVRLSTSDNDVTTEEKQIIYHHEKAEVGFELAADSLLLFYKVNDENVPLRAEVFGVDHFDNMTKIQVNDLPARIKINSYFSDYLIKVDSIEEWISIEDESSLIHCLSERTNDSLHISINNPRDIPFNYFVYRRNKEVKRGYGNAFEYHDKTSFSQNYFVLLQYLWAGKIKDENFRIPWNSKELTINVTQPAVIYPGQNSEIQIEVKDKKENPVPDVDLTAYSFTKKFNATTPGLPNLEKQKKDKEIINNFRLNKSGFEDHSRYLDYKTWKIMAGLDSIEYYKFRYPEKGIYQSSFSISDSITQFAPFVFFNGWVETVHVVYVDHEPVYFEWSENPRSYSFRIDSGYHNIVLRTRSKAIKMDSVYFPQKKKTIISIDILGKSPNMSISDVGYKLSTQEKRRLYNYIFPYRNTFGNKFSYIIQGNNAILLSGKDCNQTNQIAGPVDGRSVTFKQIDGISSRFKHEPMFEYEFLPGMIKMRNFIVENRYPSSLNSYDKKQNLTDVVVTEKKILEMWDDKIAQERYKNAKYSNPLQTQANSGTLVVDYKQIDEKASRPLNILIFKYDDHKFIRVYPGSVNTFYNLNRGLYKIIYFYPGSQYHVYDSITIIPNGLNYRMILEKKVKQKDEFSKRVNQIIEETIFKPVVYDIRNRNSELNKIKREYHENFRFDSPGDLVTGHVYDMEGKDPIPGVNVVAKGTNIGTVTDIDGYYSLKIPHNVASLVFSFIGCVTKVVNISTDDYSSVFLHADITALEEIVVTGYASMRRSSLTNSVATIDGTNVPGGIDFMGQLHGKVAGVTVNPDGGASIRVRGASTVNFNQTPLYIIDGVIYTGDINDLKSEFIDSIKILKDENATAIYGARAANGVVIISTKSNTFKATGHKLTDSQEMLASYGEKANSIRNNFSDYGYWQPRLTTDKNGLAKFNVTFPDDVTSWKTIVLAMNDKKQAGLREDLIKSFKPLMAQLALPRFMVQGDSINAIGKILNYTPDTLSLITSIEINDSTYFKETRNCPSSIIDTISFTSSTLDSLNVKYFLEKENGYLDGEERKIPVIPIGLEETTGSFHAFHTDTTINLTFDQRLGEVTFYAKSDILNVLEDEIEYVSLYKYDCNEQLASKLKVLLAQRTIYKYKGKSTQFDKKINQLINKILKNRTQEGLWGWWKNSEYSLWISLHVIEALSEAQQHGYDTKMKEDEVFDFLFWNLTSSTSHLEKVRILKLLKILNSEINFGEYITSIDPTKFTYFNELLRYWEMKLFCGLNMETDTLDYFSEETMMGNLYFSDSINNQNLLSNDIQNTILAYKILRYDSAKNNKDLQRIRNYFLERRNRGHWSNTYESAKIIEIILPDILGGKTDITKGKLKISGALNREIIEFPFMVKLKPSDSITVSKTGDLPVYFTTHQSYWNPDPKTLNREFEIRSFFEGNDSTLILEAGREMKLIVELDVKKDAEYVMIEVPIPASCTYASKDNNSRLEAHREYFKEQTSIFCKFLKTGNYKFEIDLLPRYSGKFTLNPAKAELMYFPTFYGNNEAKKIVVKNPKR